SKKGKNPKNQKTSSGMVQATHNNVRNIVPQNIQPTPPKIDHVMEQRMKEDAIKDLEGRIYKIHRNIDIQQAKKLLIEQKLKELNEEMKEYIQELYLLGKNYEDEKHMWNDWNNS